MSKKANTPKPAAVRYDAYVVKKYTGNDNKEHANWTRIGAAFPHEDSKGFNVTLDALPVDGQVVVRLYEPKAENE